ncbi:MAG: WecB/TagA/CpsF family glycosyltransferase [Planctomycetales bacterium]|nr:WecB/TagA/CpsF family glycosyltransferase [Planctomycetales bacterium]
MIDYGKKNLLGIGINAVDYESAVSRIIQAAENSQPLGVSALAVHGVMTGVFDREQCFRLNQLELVVPDGQPVRWGLNWLYRLKLPDRVYGPNLTLKVCEAAAQAGLGLYLFGSQPRTLAKLQQQLAQRFPNLVISGSCPSRFRQLTDIEKQDVIQQIKESGAQITLVGIGCPRQEVWAFEFREALSMPVLAVGAAFAFHAGELAQAPSWMQARGLEWLYRLFREPIRLWRRYLLLNPAYLTLLCLQKLGIVTLKVERGIPPTKDLLYG